MTRVRSATLALLLTTAPAWAEYRPVSWFVAHPQATNDVLRLCLDNPGQAARNDNCRSAEAASAILAEHELGRLGDPSTPRYWQQHPVEQQQQQWVCSMIRQRHAAMDPTTARVCRAAEGAG